MYKISETIGLFFIGMFAIVILSVIVSIPTWFLWNNCLVTAVDGVNEISLLQALGISLLFSILFKPTNVTSKE